MKEKSARTFESDAETGETEEGRKGRGPNDALGHGESAGEKKNYLISITDPTSGFGLELVDLRESCP